MDNMIHKNSIAFTSYTSTCNNRGKRRDGQYINSTCNLPIITLAIELLMIDRAQYIYILLHKDRPTRICYTQGRVDKLWIPSQRATNLYLIAPTIIQPDKHMHHTLMPRGKNTHIL